MDTATITKSNTFQLSFQNNRKLNRHFTSISIVKIDKKTKFATCKQNGTQQQYNIFLFLFFFFNKVEKKRVLECVYVHVVPEHKIQTNLNVIAKILFDGGKATHTNEYRIHNNRCKDCIAMIKDVCTEIV